MYSKSKKQRHVLSEVIEMLNHAYSDLGFVEVFNPIFIEEGDVYKQWGNETATILDRCFYLATLSRPDIGINQDKINLLNNIGIELEKQKKSKLQKVFHNYKKGQFDSDDLISKIAEVLSINEEKAIKVLSMFPELKEKNPKPTRTTLRSHMTSGWFITLKEFQDREALPIKLFSVDLCFRREQALDPIHLKSYHSASSVILDREVNLDDMKEVVEGLLRSFGIHEIRYVKKKRSAGYYEKNSEMEAFVKTKNQEEWVEVADFGIYNSNVLKRYGIRYPVMNLGVGAERLAMVIHGYTDVRKMVFPQFYVQVEYSDKDIASSISIGKIPKTKEGKKLKIEILKHWEKYGAAPSPYEYIVYDGLLFDKKVQVKLLQNEKGKKLLGKAAFNEIIVYDGNILGIPEKEIKFANGDIIKLARERGIPTGIRYVDSLAAMVAADIEEAVESDKKELIVKRTMTNTAGDVNIKIRDDVLNFITSKNKRVDLRGPVFMMAEVKIEKI